MELHSFIRSYLEIPVVLGLGVCRSKTMRYTYFKKQIHQDQNHYNILKNIRQVISSAPENHDFHEAPILNYHFYLHKLDEEQQLMTLIVHENNVIQSFRAPQLIRKFRENLDEGNTLFKELSTRKTILGQPVTQSPNSSKAVPPDAATYGDLSLEKINVKEVLAALNELSRFAKQYIGPKIVSTYWQLSRPKHNWLQKFDIKHSAAIQFRGDNSDVITPIQMLILREWTQNFMNQCHTIIQDLPQQFEAKNMPEKSRKILSIYTSDYLKNQKSMKQNQSKSLFGDVFF